MKKIYEKMTSNEETITNQKKRKNDANESESNKEEIIDLAEIIADFPNVVHKTSADGNTCQFCNIEFSDFKAVNIHKRAKHPQTYFACADLHHCQNPGGEQTMFEGVRQLISHHIQKHLPKKDNKFVCAVASCAQLYSDCNGLNKHLIKHHDENTLRATAAEIYRKEGTSNVFCRAPRWKKTIKKQQ